MSTNPEQANSITAEPAFDTAAAIAPSSGPRAPAYLIEYACGRWIALPAHAAYALIEYPDVVNVPGAAHYAYGLMTWQDSRLPLLDLNALLHTEQNTEQTSAPRYALVVAYQSAARLPIAFGAIGMTALPQAIAVGDEAQCELPFDSKLWPLLALSCFQHGGHPVPILSTDRIFSANCG